MANSANRSGRPNRTRTERRRKAMQARRAATRSGVRVLAGIALVDRTVNPARVWALQIIDDAALLCREWSFAPNDDLTRWACVSLVPEVPDPATHTIRSLTGDVPLPLLPPRVFDLADLTWLLSAVILGAERAQDGKRAELGDCPEINHIMATLARIASPRMAPPVPDLWGDPRPTIPSEWVRGLVGDLHTAPRRIVLRSGPTS